MLLVAACMFACSPGSQPLDQVPATGTSMRDDSDSSGGGTASAAVDAPEDEPDEQATQAAPAVAESRGKLPPQLGRAFGLPLGPKDSQGNLLVRRDGRLADPATGWAYEIWLKRPRMEFVLVPAGEFAMGCLDSVGSVCARYGGEYGDYLWEVPAHQVRLSAAFYVGKYEVTNQQFAAFRPSHSSGKYSARQTGRRRRNRPTQATVTLNQPNQPAVQVSWQDAAAFCQWLRQRTAAVAGLPTEAEWEWACRGGRCTLFHWGPNADSVGQLANTADRTARANWSWGETTVDDRYAGPAPVGRFPPNPFGLYDTVICTG